MKPFGNPKVLPGGYKMEMSCKDATYYFYIPLELFRSVEMDGSAGNSGSVEVHGNDEGCCCCCGVSRLFQRRNQIFKNITRLVDTSFVLFDGLKRTSGIWL